MPPKENDNVYWCRNIVWRCAFCQAETEHVVHHCVKSQASKASVGPPLCLHQSVPHCQPCWPKSNDKYIKSDDTIKTPKGDWNCDLINSQDYVPPSKRPSSIHWPWLWFRNNGYCGYQCAKIIMHWQKIRQSTNFRTKGCDYAILYCAECRCIVYGADEDCSFVVVCTSLRLHNATASAQSSVYGLATVSIGTRCSWQRWMATRWHTNFHWQFVNLSISYRVCFSYYIQYHTWYECLGSCAAFWRYGLSYKSCSC